MPGQTQQDRMRAANADWQRAKESDQDIDEYMANESRLMRAMGGRVADFEEY